MAYQRRTRIDLDTLVRTAHIDVMRIGSLISLIAATFGVPPETVTVVARALREAGWLTSGARGVNAPEMGTRDAARLSLALLSGEPPSRVVTEFEFLRSLQTNEQFPDQGLICRADLPEDHTLEDLLTVLFAIYADQDRILRNSVEVGTFRGGPYFSISVDASRRAATVSLPDRTAEYVDLAGETELASLYAKRPMDLETLEQITEIESRSIASDAGISVVAGRGMRVVRTITQREIEVIATHLLGLESG